MTTTYPDSSESPAQRFTTLLWRLVSARQWERALEVAREWLAWDPESSQAQLAAGQALVNLKQYAAARPHLEKALSGQPRNGFAHRLLSIVCFHERKQGAAEDHIQQAIALEPNDATHWYHLAWMRYRQNALEVAARHAQRALELNPGNADTLNLLAICERDHPEAQLDRYRRALELDPESSVVHNNLGTYYLNQGRDPGRAEELFRRALMLDPTDETAQKNLFLVLRRRDPVYRVLVAPRHCLNFFSLARGRRGALRRFGAVLVWLMVWRYVVAVFVCWLGLVYPLVKVYEHLTLGDIRAQAGVVGARRGGWFGFRRWPFAVRFGILVALALLFWGTIYFAYQQQWIPPEILAGAVGAAVLFFLGRALVRSVKNRRARSAIRRAERKFTQHRPPPADGRPPRMRANLPVTDRDDIYQ